MTQRAVEHPVAAALPARNLSGPALRAFFRISAAWGLKSAEERVLLGQPPESTFFKWKKEQDGTLSRDVLERISSEFGRARELDPKLAAVRFPGRSLPRRARAGANVSQMHYARRGIVTPEMEFVAIRENQRIEAVRDAGHEIVGVVTVLDRLAGGAERIKDACGAPYLACATIDEIYPDRPTT